MSCISDKSVILKSQNFLDQKSNLMYDMMLKKSHCDFEIIVKDKRIAVHKIVMITAWDYFKNYNWDLEKRGKEIDLGDFKLKAVERVISFCYTGQIELFEEYISDVFSLAMKLGIDELIHTGLNYFLKCMNLSNCIQLCKSANRYDKVSVKEAIFGFVFRNFSKIMETDEFLLLDHDLISEILKSNKIHVGNETEVFKALKSWIIHDKSERAKFFNELLTHIKLDQLPLNYLINEVQSFCLIINDCNSLIINAIKNNTMIYPMASMTTPRSSTMRALICSGREYNKASTIELFNPFDGSTQIYCELKFENIKEISSYCAVIIRNYLFIIGGYGGQSGVQKMVLMADLQNKTIRTLPPMLKERGEARAIELDGYLYVVGGFDGKTQLDSVERMDLKNNSWVNVAPLRSIRAGFGICSYDGNIYIAGGHPGGFHNELEVYSPKLNEWSQLKPMNKKRNYVELVVCMGKICAISGSSQNLADAEGMYSDIEIYDPKSNNWTLIDVFPTPRMGVGACSIDNKIIIYGGKGINGTLSETYVYDLDKNKLETFTHTGRTHPHVLSVSVNFLSQL